MNLLLYREMNKMNVGRHLLGNLHGCPVGLLETVAPIKEIMHRTVLEAELTSVGEIFHQYEPVGVTGVILISDSHFSIHTWPEYELAAVDIFSCSEEGDPERAFDILCKYLSPKKVDKQLIIR